MRILIVTADHVGRQRAGPAIRCVELARILGMQHEVTVASYGPIDVEANSFHSLPDCFVKRSRLIEAAKRNDVVITQGPVLENFPSLRRLTRHLVVDLYDAYLLEYLENAHSHVPNWGYLRQWHYLNDQLRRGDFFLCATERQRDYWLGRLCSLGRLNVEEYRHDPTFRRLLDVTPFGLSTEFPRHTRQVLKGVIPGINPSDCVLLWGGGIWQWFDPITVIRAAHLAHQLRDDIKLVFLGTQHPNPTMKVPPILSESKALARELGALDHSVFFLEGWVPFAERQNYLLEADIGVSAHPDTIEARLSFRTRVLDYIWAGLPMILSRGDHFAEVVERQDLGRTVAPGDVEGWKRAILYLAGDSAGRAAIRSRVLAIAPTLSWERVTAPLVKYCSQPYHTVRPSAARMAVVPLLSTIYRKAKYLLPGPHNVKSSMDPAATGKPSQGRTQVTEQPVAINQERFSASKSLPAAQGEQETKT